MSSDHPISTAAREGRSGAAPGAALGAALAALLASATAQAQPQVQSVTVTRAARGAMDVRMGNQGTVDWISHDDCMKNVQFDLTITGAAASFATYVVTSSAALTAGACTPGPGCWTPCTVCSSGTVTFGAAALVQNVLGVNCDGVPTAAALGALPASGPVPLTFSFVDPSAPDTPGTWAGLDVELTAPPPPTALGLGSGDGELVLDLPAVPDANTVGYYVFCVPASPTGGAGSTTASSAGTSGMGTGGIGMGAMGTGAMGTGGMGMGGSGTGGLGTGTGGAGGGASNLCPPGTPFPVDPLHPDIHSPYVCGPPIEASVSTVRIIKQGDGGLFADGQGYVLAVAAYDDVYNVGPLSPLLCNTPQPTGTFLKEYCTDAGSGCAGCSLGEVGAGVDPAWPVLGIAGLGIAGLVARRGRRKR